MSAHGYALHSVCPQVSFSFLVLVSKRGNDLPMFTLQSDVSERFGIMNHNLLLLEFIFRSMNEILNGSVI